MNRKYVNILKDMLESSEMFDLKRIKLIDSQSVELEVSLKPQEDLPVLENRIYRFGEYEFIENLRLLSHKGHSWRLSLTLTKILLILLIHKEKVVKRDFLTLEVWGDNSVLASKRLDVNLFRLRSYFRSDSSVQILTIKMTGVYLFVRK